MCTTSILASLRPRPSFGDALDALPGRKFIFTNGSRRHAEAVIARLGLDGHFDDLFDIHALGLHPQAEREAYERFLGAYGVAGASAAMFDDLPHNLETAHALGMTTVLVATGIPTIPSIRRWPDGPSFRRISITAPMRFAPFLAEIGALPALRRASLTDIAAPAAPIVLRALRPSPTMTHDHLKTFIDSAYEHAVEITPETKGVVRDAVEEVLDLLDKGELRVAEKLDGDWVVHQWLKKAILLSFRLNEPQKVDGGPDGGAWWDKVPTKFAKWKAKDFKEAGFRAVPGAVVRRSAYIAPGVVLMPSFVNLGARVDRAP